MKSILIICVSVLLCGCMSSSYVSTSDFAKRKEYFHPTEGFVDGNRLYALGCTQIWNAFADPEKRNSYIAVGLPMPNRSLDGEIEWVDPGSLEIPGDAFHFPVVKQKFRSYREKETHFETNDLTYAIYDNHIFFKTPDGDISAAHYRLGREYLPIWNFPAWSLGFLGNVALDIVTLPAQIIMIPFIPNIDG